MDHLLPAHDKPLEQSTTPNNAPLLPDLPLPNQSDFVPIVETEHSAQSPIVGQRTDQPVTEGCYPTRVNRQPPARHAS